MLDIRTTQTLQMYISELAALAPPTWQKIVVYRELSRDSDGYLRNSALEEFLDASGQTHLELPGSVDAYDALERFHTACWDRGDNWLGMRLELHKDGNYSTEFFYGSTPLLDADYDEAEKRLKGSN